MNDDVDLQLYRQAVADVLEFRKASASWLQRRLRIGYSHAARMVEKMEREGIVGPPDHVGRREVLRDRDGPVPEAKDTAPPPWRRNEGKYDRPSSAPQVQPKAKKPVHPDAPAKSTAEEYRADMERKALRGTAALAPVKPIDADSLPPLIAWPATATIEEDGSVSLVALPAAAEKVHPEAVSVARLRMIIERLEALAMQRAEINAIMADVRAFAKAIGFETAAITAVIRMRAQDQEKRLNFEAALETYRHAMGVEGPSFVIALPAVSTAPPEPVRKLSAKEKARFEAVLLAELAEEAQSL